MSDFGATSATVVLGSLAGARMVRGRASPDGYRAKPPDLVAALVQVARASRGSAGGTIVDR